MRFYLFLILGLLAGTGCGEEASQVSETPSELAAEDEVVPESPEAVDFEVHEWGLADCRLTDPNTISLHTAPGAQRPQGDPVARPASADSASMRRPSSGSASMMRPSSGSASMMRPRPQVGGIIGMASGSGIQARAPLLWVHLAPDAEPLELVFDVMIPNGEILERFPAAPALPQAENAGGGVRFAVTAQPGTCRTREYPSPDDPMCDLEDGHCEAALLADYETDDAACLEYEGERYNHLFYRGKGARPELPFAVRGTPGGVVSVGGQGHAPAGAMLRLTRGESEVFVSRVAATADGSVDVAPADASSTIGVTAGRRAVRDAMLELGLTNAEAESFLRAWQGELFTVEAGLADALIYFAPPTAADTLSRVTITPAPSRFARALMVRVDLSP